MKGERSATGPTPGGGRAWHRWHFADAVLDERSLELTVKGTDTELERKPLEALLFLLQHAGEVCTKDELLAGIWPGRVLSETVLTKCIGRLREALRDENQDIIKTVYGFGYRFTAPVQVESIQVPEPSRFDFRPGDHLPARPLWSLVERLGAGGHGEAWRVRHDKTGEQRVFKFALDETSLGALKREITLFRVINDTLGASARVVRLLDWNLEQDPYFVEAEWVPGGNLIDWVQLRGGGTAVPLEQRLEVVALLAEALAAVHSVGVLHKDLKPSNILVRPTAGHAVQVLLADFGSGAVLDDTYLEKLGITRLGFTKTLSTMAGVAGTPMYLAPEILAGQPFTVKTDIYALGVILYQFVVGDFNRLMSPGWERDIADELLREDIAALAEGNPAVRLGDVEQVARRLRALPERRAQLQAKRESQAHAERAQRLLERARARRFGLAFAFVALLIGLATSTFLFFQARAAQGASERAAARSRAVTEFLTKDAFAAVAGSQSVKDIRVEQLLVNAGNQIDVRFADQPAVAADLHYVIGRSLREFYESDQAAEHFRRALELDLRIRAAGSQPALRIAADLVYTDYVLGLLPRKISIYDATLAAGRSSFGPHDKAVLDLREQLARGRYMLGNWSQSARDLESLLADANAADIDDPTILGRAYFYLGQAQLMLASPAAAEVNLRAAIVQLTKAFGEAHREVSEARHALGRALTDTARYEEARAQLDLSASLAEKWEPQLTWTVVRPRYFKALLLLETGEPEQARSLLSAIVDFQVTHTGQKADLDHTGMVREALAETYLRTGDFQTAIDILRTAFMVSAEADGTTHPQTRFIRLTLAEALLAAGPTAESRALIAFAVRDDFADLPRLHPFVAQMQRVRGLFALASGDRAESQRNLQDALLTYESLYGPRHWRTQRAHAECEKALR